MQANHINVCICTFKRGAMLLELLNKLEHQRTDNLFTYSIVVADNDHLRSGEAVVSQFAVKSAVPVRYCVEPRQNIALTRNKAIEHPKLRANRKSTAPPSNMNPLRLQFA